MILSKCVSDLREESSQRAFLEEFGNIRPHLAGADIDRAYRKAITTVGGSERPEALEREMEMLLGIVSDEEE